MRYCYHCRRITAGQPLFCNYCGRSYDVKLCPRLHPNPRTAEVCSQCGSHELSTPQPRSPLWVRASMAALALLPGVFLLFLSVLLLTAGLHTLVTNQLLLGRFLLLALLLGLLWFVYMQLPGFVRKAVQKAWRRAKRDEHSHST